MPSQISPPQRHTLLTDGPVGRHLLRLTPPMAWGILAIMTFNLVDAYFVGQLGTLPLAALTFTFPAVMMVTSLGIGFSIGTSSTLSRAIGAMDRELSQRLTMDSLLLSVVLAVGVTLTGLLSIEPLFHWLGASSKVQPLIHRYMNIWYLGSFFLLASMVGGAAIRAAGNTLIPGLIMVGGAILNLILDPLLIFGFGPVPSLGISGAAIATVTARVISLLVTLAFLFFRFDQINLHRPRFSQVIQSWKKILHVALPATITNVITPVALAVITGLVAAFGPATVAGFGVASRIEFFAIVPILALTASMGPIIGQNWGANQPTRVYHTMQLCFRFCIVWGLAMTITLGLAGHWLVSLFNENAAVIRSGGLYLWLVPVSYGAWGVIVCSNAAFNAIGRPIVASALNLSRSIFLYVPIAWLAAKVAGETGIYASNAVASFIVAGVAWWWSRRLRAGNIAS